MQFHYGSVLRWKKFTQGLSYVVCTQARKHVHKRITKRRYEEEEPGRFVFGKPVLFTLGLGLTTPDSLGILVWNFYQTFVTVSIDFWLGFEPQIRPITLAINFLFVNARAERKVRLCVKLFDFFRGWILIRLTWNLLRFVPNSVEILGCNFKKKTIMVEILRNFVETKAILYRNFWNSGLISTNSFCVCIALKKIQTSTFVCCLQPGKEAHPKTNQKKKIRGRKSRTFCFRKTSFFTLGLGLTMPYSLGILVWNFYQTFVTMSIEFWLRFEPQIRPTILTIKF